MVAKAEAPKPVESSALVPINVNGETAVAGFQHVQTTRGNYVSFPKAGKTLWDDLRAKWRNFEEYEPVLVRQTPAGNEFERIATDMTFRAYWLGGYHCWANFDINSGAVLAASRTAAESPLIENVEGVLIVVTPEGLMPAKCSFRKALASAGVSMDQAGTQKVQSPDWLKDNPHHAKVPPQYRFKADIRVSVKPSRNPRAMGMPYPLANTRIVPTTTEEIQKLQDAMRATLFQDALKACVIGYRERVREIETRFPEAAK